MRALLLLLPAILLLSCGASNRGPSHVLAAERLPMNAYCRGKAHLLAATSVEQMSSTAPCLKTVEERAATLYVAVIWDYECTSRTTTWFELHGSTIQAREEFSRPQGVCVAAMAIPGYSVYAIPTQALPAGPLTVELVKIDDAVGPGSSVVASVPVEI